MYKILLTLRYLRTRYIAMASIISVTLGVATMIVVNSVMAGFREEMVTRMHDVLSDIVIQSQSLGGMYDVESLMTEVGHVLGDDLEGMTTTVHVPAMLNYQYNGEWITRQINLVGIDEATYAKVSDIGEFLLHPVNQDQLDFQLHEGGYSSLTDSNARKHQLESAGWVRRRHRINYERTLQSQRDKMSRAEHPLTVVPPPLPTTPLDLPTESVSNASHEATYPPSLGPRPMPLNTSPGESPSGRTGVARAPPSTPSPPSDPFSAYTGDESVKRFDAMVDQHTGVVLGIGLTSVRRQNADGEIEDFFLCLPGDDVKITFPTSGTPPQAISDTFTVVDLYESNMVEHDSSFVFMPLRRLQELRGMIDPQTGEGAVTTIQIRLREEADLALASQRLRERFPAQQYLLQIQTWKELQGPLLSAVQLELTLLNILLFLIIAVAGFGILAIFYMIVVEKTKDIGVLKSLGAPSGGVRNIFLGYGLSLGIAGSGVGTLLGLLFVKNINQIAGWVEVITGREVFPADIYYFQEIPTIISLPTIAWIVGGAMAIAVIAAVLPSMRAARLHPVEALRYE